MIYPQKWATGDGTAENPWANGCIKSAYDNVPEGGTIFLRAGYYQLAGEFSIAKQINIIGEGMGSTIVKTANDYGFWIHGDGDYVSIKNLTIDGDAQTDNQNYLSCIAVEIVDYLVLENIEAKNAGTIGIMITDMNHVTFKNIHVHDNYTHGIHSASNLAGRAKYNTYRDIYSWNNGVYGFDDCSLSLDDCYNLYDNIQAWDNGEDGIVFWWISGGIVSNCSAWGNAENGIVFGYAKNFDVHDCIFNLNDFYGIRIAHESENINFTNVTAKNNNVLDNDTSEGSSAVAVSGSSFGIKFTSCQFYDDRVSPLQDYGIFLYDAIAPIEILNCKLLPNRTGEIYNPDGVAIKVITEKMLAKF
jgi:hypothetical protein